MAVRTKGPGSLAGYLTWAERPAEIQQPALMLQTIQLCRPIGALFVTCHHSPWGSRLERRAIQLGLRGSILRRYATRRAVGGDRHDGAHPH
jgi:hypothetical protein